MQGDVTRYLELLDTNGAQGLAKKIRHEMTDRGEYLRISDKEFDSLIDIAVKGHDICVSQFSSACIPPHVLQTIQTFRATYAQVTTSVFILTIRKLFRDKTYFVIGIVHVSSMPRPGGAYHYVLTQWGGDLSLEEARHAKAIRALCTPSLLVGLAVYAWELQWVWLGVKAFARSVWGILSTTPPIYGGVCR